MKKLNIATLVLLLSSFIIHCSLDSPKAPSYDVPIKFVLIDTTYNIKELTFDADNFFINDSSNSLEIKVDGATDTVTVEQHLKIPGVNYNAEFELNEFEIAINQSVTDTSLTLGKLNPALKQYDGTVQIISPFSFSSVVTDTIVLGEIVYVVVASGQATVTLENHLNVPIDAMSAFLFDESGNSIEQIEFPGEIRPGASASQVVDLSGKRFSNRIYIIFSGHSAGSGNVPQLVDVNDYLLVKVTINSIKASEAGAKLWPTYLSTEKELKLTDEFSITEAKIATGNLQLKLEKSVQLDFNARIVFEHILKDDSPLTIELHLDNSNNQSNYEYNIDLAGALIKPTPASGGEAQKMKVQIAAFTEDTSDVVYLDQNDAIKFGIKIDEITLEYISGVLNQQPCKISSNVFTYDIPQGFEDIQLKNVNINLDFYNRVGFPITIDAYLKGTSKSGEVADLHINHTLLAAEARREKLTRLILDESNSEFVNFMNNFPSSIEVSGMAYVGDGNTPGTIYRDDYVRLQYQITTPLQLSFDEKYIKLDTTRLVIKPEGYNGNEIGDAQTIDASSTEFLKYGELNITVSNHFPLGMEVRVMIDTNLDSLFNSPQVLLGPIAMPAGKLNESGLVVTESKKENKVILDTGELEIFKNNSENLKTIYIGTEIHLLGTNGEMVAISPNDYLKITSSTFLKIKVNP